MRVHKLPGGDLRVHRKGDPRGVVFVPTWCQMVGKRMTRLEAATALRDYRREKRTAARVTPGYKRRLSIKRFTTAHGHQRASYWSALASRWLPIPRAEADAFLAAGQADEYKHDLERAA